MDSSPAKKSSDEQFVLSELERIVKADGGTVPPLFVLSRRHYYGLWQEGVKNVLLYIETYFHPKDVRERKQILYVLLSVLSVYLKQGGVSVSLENCVSQLHRISDVIDSQFPGYRENGLLLKLIEKKNDPTYLSTK